jgi:ribosomal protein S18 acetylase RimI-like enzyme
MSTHTAFTIRPATIDDAESVGAMIEEFRSYLTALGDTGLSFGREQYRRDGFGANPAFKGLIAERGNDMLGYALYAPDYNTDEGRRTIYLHDLFVRAAFRGQGVGDALMERLAEICRAAGGQSIYWHVWHTNESAMRFYERIGARSIDTVRLMGLDV